MCLRLSCLLPMKHNIVFFCLFGLGGASALCPFQGRSVKATAHQELPPGHPAVPHTNGPTAAYDAYAKAFSALDLDAVRNDLKEIFVNSQDEWPADYGVRGSLGAQARSFLDKKQFIPKVSLPPTHFPLGRTTPPSWFGWRGTVRAATARRTVGAGATAGGSGSTRSGLGWTTPTSTRVSFAVMSAHRSSSCSDTTTISVPATFEILTSRARRTTLLAPRHPTCTANSPVAAVAP